MVWTAALNPAILLAALLAPAGSCALSLGALGERFEVSEVRGRAVDLKPPCAGQPLPEPLITLDPSPLCCCLLAFQVGTRNLAMVEGARMALTAAAFLLAAFSRTTVRTMDALAAAVMGHWGTACALTHASP